MTTSWGLRGWATTAPPAFVQRLILSFKVLYIILIVCLNVVAGGGGSNLYTEEELPFTDEQVQERILGSKIVVISEQVGPPSGLKSLHSTDIIGHAQHNLHP